MTFLYYFYFKTTEIWRLGNDDMYASVIFRYKLNKRNHVGKYRNKYEAQRGVEYNLLMSYVFC